jgi:MoxR-like ATPase
MAWNPSFIRYHGDGRVPPGCSPQRRGEHGDYLADPELVLAVNTSLAVGQPLLLTGEPGTGKTMLAWSIASELGLGDVLEFHTRSDHQARDTLYSFDNLRRFYDAQNRDPRAEDLNHYVRLEPLGLAIASPSQRVVLIDEIDKAPRDFPNDLLDELDRMKFLVHETGVEYNAVYRPVVIITSNSERQLPAPFLRRCVFHHIAFPTAERLERILHERLGHLHLRETLSKAAIRRFEELRRLDGLEKLAATSELLSWVRVLLAAGVDEPQLSSGSLAELPLLSALVKTRADLERIGKHARRAA